MKPRETQSNTEPAASPARSHRRGGYQKVCNARNHPIRGLWRRNGRFIARVTVEDPDTGQKRPAWHPLTDQHGSPVSTVSEAVDALHRLKLKRKDAGLSAARRPPKLGDYIRDTYLPALRVSGKKQNTIKTETYHLGRWTEALAEMRLDKIRPRHITSQLDRRAEAGVSPRTLNLDTTCLRNVLSRARTDGWITSSPADGLPWRKTSQKKRVLFTPEQINQVALAGFRPLYCSSRLARDGEQAAPLKNAQQFYDYVTFLRFSGCREKEALQLRWEDVDFEREFVTVGDEGTAKNRRLRQIDFNPELRNHLAQMHERRAPDSQWLFPSPQRGEEDKPARSFRESLKLARAGAGIPTFSFHDTRHHFISYAVMSGIDFMTIAKWVGHQDGGVLIGKVYGHLADDHRKTQAARLAFSPVLLVNGQREAVQ